MQAPVRLGIDVGGTFTDLIAQGDNGEVQVVKVSSTPEDPSIGVMDGITKFVDQSAVEMGDIGSLFHGSTVSTNALIERDGADAGLLITEGYNAVPVVGNQSRPDSETINPFYEETDFLIPHKRVKEVPERVDSTSEIVKKLDEEAVRTAVRELKAEGVNAIAVSYLFSFMNERHEERTLEIIQDEYPECFVSLSSRVIPRIREYPRMSTTAIDSYVGPVLSEYLQNLQRKLESKDISTEQVYLMLSHGGLVPFSTAANNTCRTLLSGPAAGVKGAAFFGDQINEPNLVTMDMGGTSCDISLVHDGEISETTEGSIENHPLSVPMIEISAITAGGGTQASLQGGHLEVGPESSGADPGPVCYGRGGTVPTITDANVILGRLNQDTLLDGEIEVAFDQTETAIEEKIADPLSMDTVEAAAGILELVNDKMKKEINLQLTKYGYDPRQFSLLAYGGAGPTHAARIAEKLDMPQVIVPRWPGINSAAGLLSTDVRQAYVESNLQALANLSEDTITDQFQELEREAIEARMAEGFAREEITTDRKLDLRYEGQGYELSIDVPEIDTDTIR